MWISFGWTTYIKNNEVMQVVYRIQSKQFEDRFYIGRTCNFETRTWKHRTSLNQNKHHSIKLQRHFDKYGHDDLEYTIVEECDNDNILDREQYYIDTLTPYFNCYMSSFGREKGSVPWNFGIKVDTIPWNKGKKMNEEQRIALIGHLVSDETRLKISNSKKGHIQNKDTIEKRSRSLYKPIEQYDLNGNLLNVFDSIKNASLKTLVGRVPISVCCRGVQKTAGGFVWKFIKQTKIKEY